MKKHWLITFLMFSGFLLVSCTLPASEDAIATAIAETAQVEDMRALYEAQTAEAQEPTATDPPSILNSLFDSLAESPNPSIPTDTPLPVSTPTPEPPAGMAYVPDFIGMTWDEVSKIFKELGLKKGYYVAAIKRDIDEWTVFQQEPEPGILVDKEDGRVKVIVAVYEFTPTPTREPRPRDSFADNCGGVTYIGYCESYSEVVWCEDNQLWIWDCEAYCSGGYCGYAGSVVGYTCFCP